MKKMLMALTMTGIMAVAGVCSAAGEGKILTKDQAVAEKVIALMNGTGTYDVIQPSLAGNAAKASLSEKSIANLQKQIKAAGKVQINEFRAFNRVNANVDLVRYVLKYEKSAPLIVDFLFDKTGKVVEFGLQAVQQPAPKAPAQQAAAPKAPAKK